MDKLQPVAWIDKNTGKPRMEGFIQTDHDIPLYTHPAEHDLGIAEAIGFEKGHEAGRQLGMKQERALWNLSESTQEIMNAHPVKELTDEEIDNLIMEVAEKPTNEDLHDFARAILKRASEK